jgi:hypothetical protein
MRRILATVHGARVDDWHRWLAKGVGGKARGGREEKAEPNAYKKLAATEDQMKLRWEVCCDVKRVERRTTTLDAIAHMPRTVRGL